MLHQPEYPDDEPSGRPLWVKIMAVTIVVGMVLAVGGAAIQMILLGA